MIPVVYAIGNGQIALPSGAVASVLRGQCWPKSDQVVAAAPGLFSDDPRTVLVYSEAPAGYDADLNELPAKRPAKRAADEEAVES